MPKVLYATFRHKSKIYSWSIPPDLELPEKLKFAIVTTEGHKCIVRVESIKELSEGETPPTNSMVRFFSKKDMSEWLQYRVCLDDSNPALVRHQKAMRKELDEWEADGLDPKPYLKKGFGLGRLIEIRTWLQMGFDASELEECQGSADQLRKLRRNKMRPIAKALGLLPDGLTKNQQEQVFLGIEHRVDVTQYNHAKIAHGIMKQLRLCLEAGVPVEKKMWGCSKKKIATYRENWLAEQEKPGTESGFEKIVIKGS